MFVFSADVFDLSLSDSCLQENEETTENGINPELAKVSYTEGSHVLVSVITQLRLPTHSIIIFNSTCVHSIHPSVSVPVVACFHEQVHILCAWIITW